MAKKLTKTKVRLIRARAAKGENYIDIGNDVGLSSSTISNIATGRSYPDYPGTLTRKRRGKACDDDPFHIDMNGSHTSVDDFIHSMDTMCRQWKQVRGAMLSISKLAGAMNSVK